MYMHMQILQGVDNIFFVGIIMDKLLCKYLKLV